MKVVLDLKEYEINKNLSYYNNQIFVSRFNSKDIVALKYYDDCDQVDVRFFDGNDWRTLFSTSYYHDFDHEFPIEGVYGDVWY